MTLPCPRCGAQMAESEEDDRWICPQCSYDTGDTGEDPIPA